MQIRAETAADHDAITRVIEAAFSGAEHSSGNEARIVSALRDRDELTLSLVAEIDGNVVGHVALSPVRLNDSASNWLGLGPVSVAPIYQGNGIGDALIRTALAELPRLGAAGCVLLGDPAYYTRFGFQQHTSLRYPEVPSEFFMALSRDGSFPTSNVSYSSAFSVA